MKIEANQIKKISLLFHSKKEFFYFLNPTFIYITIAQSEGSSATNLLVVMATFVLVIGVVGVVTCD
jgi:hypothetical protein